MMTIECAYRHYETTEQEEKAFARLGEELAALDSGIR